MAQYIDERGERVSTQDTQKKVQMSGMEARQGFLGRPVLIVLVCGLALAIVAWVGAEFFGEATDNDARTGVEQTQPADAQPSQQGTMTAPPATDGTVEQAPADKNPNPQSGSGG